MQKNIYLNNKELLAEIHKCKVSYCEFERREHADFDAIVQDLSEITPELIEATRAKKAASLTPKKAPPVDPATIPVETLVFRVMTFDHIPIDPNRKRKARNGVNHTRTSFPPFKHYIIEPTGPREVCRSHWKGDFETGEFAPERGRISNTLAAMFMLLVKRYSKRRNWRGYCVDEQTEALTQRGWVSGDELTTDDIILSYEGGDLKWSRIKDIFRDDYDGDMFHLKVAGMDALVTPGHRFVTTGGLKKVEYLLETDKLVLSGNAVEAPPVATYSDSFVDLIGWVVTEGSIYTSNDRNYHRIDIYQNEGRKAEKIRESLTSLGFSFGDGRAKTCRRFNLPKELCQQVASVIDINNKALTMPFILSLTHEQRLQLIETMIDGDGHRTGSLRRYTQRNQAHTDSFVALCTLAGIRTSVKRREHSAFGKKTECNHVVLFSDRVKHSRVENIDFHGGKRNGKVKGLGKKTHPNEPTVPYKGKVWCPVTEYGSFMCRRNGYVFLTGNSYVDEMENHALVQLSQMGLQFDESKSDNPFAFYTTTVKNSYTRVQNLERKSQNIRDDLLIMAGASPSYTRQISDELQAKTDAESTSSSYISGTVYEADEKLSKTVKPKGKPAKKPTSQGPA